MHKSLIVALIFVSVSVFVSAADSKQYEQTDSLISLIENQNNYDFQSVDSLCYKYYLTGNWNELLKTGKDAIREGIDYKRLRYISIFS